MSNIVEKNNNRIAEHEPPRRPAPDSVTSRVNNASNPILDRAIDFLPTSLRTRLDYKGAFIRVLLNIPEEQRANALRYALVDPTQVDQNSIDAFVLAIANHPADADLEDFDRTLITPEIASPNTMTVLRKIASLPTDKIGEVLSLAFLVIQAESPPKYKKKTIEDLLALPDDRRVRLVAAVISILDRDPAEVHDNDDGRSYRLWKEILGIAREFNLDTIEGATALHYALQFVRQGMFGADIKHIIEAVCYVPSTETENIIRKVLLLRTDQMGGWEIGALIYTVAKLPESIFQLVLQLRTEGMRAWEIIELIQNIKMLRLRTDDTNVGEIQALLLTLKNLLFFDRMDVFDYALSLKTDGMYSQEIHALIRTIANLLNRERANIMHNASKLITDDMNAEYRCAFIQAVADLPFHQRAHNVQRALQGRNAEERLEIIRGAAQQAAPNAAPVQAGIGALQARIDRGAEFLKSEVLADADTPTKTDFQNVAPEIFQFIATKAVGIYAAGPRRGDAIPDFFKPATREAIGAFRTEIRDKNMLRQLQELTLTPNAALPKDPAILSAFNRLKGIASEEIQGENWRRGEVIPGEENLLTRACWQKAAREIQIDER